VSVVLKEPHPLVAATLKLIKGASTFQGRLVLDFKHALRIQVSPIALERALRLFDRLIKASEQKGYVWSITAEGSTLVICDGESMKVDLKERLTKREIPQPATLKRLQGRRWEPNYAAIIYPEYEWVSTNQLNLSVGEYARGAPSFSWKDAKRTTLEDKINDIVAGIPALAAGIAARREKQEERQREWALQEENRREAARNAETLRRLRLRLVNTTLRWEQTSRLRHFCDAVEAKAATLPAEEVGAVDRWLAWARKQADLLDPLLSDLSSLSSMEVHLPTWFKGIYNDGRSDPDWWAPEP
jgi:hypothetical protein